MILAGTYRSRALRAVTLYQAGRRHLEYPKPGAVGYCGQAARALWEDVHNRAYPYRAASALKMERALDRAEWLVTPRSGLANDYHTACADGRLVEGAMLFMPYGQYGHVVTVVEVTGDPSLSLANVRVFENTSALRRTAGNKRGTVISRLDEVCGSIGSDRITGVGTYGL